MYKVSVTAQSPYFIISCLAPFNISFDHTPLVLFCIVIIKLKNIFSLMKDCWDIFDRYLLFLLSYLIGRFFFLLNICLSTFLWNLKSSYWMLKVRINDKIIVNWTMFQAKLLLILIFITDMGLFHTCSDLKLKKNYKTVDILYIIFKNNVS